MKIFGLLQLLSISFFGFSQDSFDFSTALPVGEKAVQAVEKNYFGSYAADNNETFYEFDAQGVWITSTIYSSISRETIRESSKYIVRNGYIFGIALHDSLPCELEGELYHFGLRNKEQIIGPHSENVLKKINAASYLICFYENGGYTPSHFTFSGKKLDVKHFDYEIGTAIFSNIERKTSKTVNGMNYITLSPTIDECKEIFSETIFGPIFSYSKE